MTRRKSYELNEGKGPSMWRSLEEKKTDPEELKKLAEEERPGGFVTDLLSPKALVSRRSFVQGSSIAALAAGLQGCVRRPENEIFPYSKAPEHTIPGVASHYATVTARGRDTLGVVVTSHDGRPTKVEGNRYHLAGLGGTDVRAQAYVWDLYDPDRSQSPARRRGHALVNATDAEAEQLLDDLVKKHDADEGAGLRFLAPISNSPSFRRMREKVLARFPKARFHTYSPVNDDNAREGARIAFGAPVAPVLDYSKARVVVSLGSDFLGREQGAVAAARRFAVTRRPASPAAPMNRLYVVESDYSITGSMADHRLRIPRGYIERFARALAAELARRGVTGLETFSSFADAGDIDPQWLKSVGDDLFNTPRRSIVVAGSGQPARVHALAHAMNEALENAGTTVMYAPAADSNDEPSVASVRTLVNDAPNMTTLVMLAGNPVYDAPADLKFAEVLESKSLTSVHVSTHRDETSSRCTWHIPLTHELEAWGDQRSLMGVRSVQQPLIAPLYGGRSEIEILAIMAGEKNTRGHEIAEETFQATLGPLADRLGFFGETREAFTSKSQWNGSLHDGTMFTGFLHPRFRNGFLRPEARTST